MATLAVQMFRLPFSFAAQILMPSDFNWIRSRDGHVPPFAVEAGTTVEGEMLYIGRAYQNGVPCLGKVRDWMASSSHPYFTFILVDLWLYDGRLSGYYARNRDVRRYTECYIR